MTYLDTFTLCVALTDVRNRNREMVLSTKIQLLRILE